MTTQNEIQHSLGNKSFGKRALQGAGITLAGMTVFLSIIFGTGDALAGMNFLEAAWQFLPLVTATVGGSLGGMVYYLMVDAWYPAGWKKVIAVIVSILVYIVLVWMSMIAGFSATGQWD